MKQIVIKMTLKCIVNQSLVDIYVEKFMSQDQEASKVPFYQSGIHLYLVLVIGLVSMINRVKEHGGMTQMTARLPFCHGEVVSLMVELVRTAPISTIIQEQNGMITIVAMLDVILYVS